MTDAYLVLLMKDNGCVVGFTFSEKFIYNLNEQYIVHNYLLQDTITSYRPLAGYFFKYDSIMYPCVSIELKHQLTDILTYIAKEIL